MRVLIFEDELIAYDKLVGLLREVRPEIEVVAHAKSIEEGHGILRDHQDIDLAFMDIQLEDGLSFSLLENFSFCFPIIFTTAFDKYAVRAFDHHSIGYLLKPIRKTDLQNIFEKFVTYHGKDATGYQQAMTSILDQMKSNEYKERFTVKIGDRLRVFKDDEIAGFFSRLKGSFLLTSSGKQFCLDDSLDVISGQVSPKNYFRVNRKYIVKIDAIDTVLNFRNSRLKIELTLPFDEDIIVARDRVKSFKVWLEGQ